VDAVAHAATEVLSVRSKHAGSTLADLYDPLSMPSDLLKAHLQLDRCVDSAYGYKGQGDDISRVAFLFALYQKLTTLFTQPPKRTRSKSKKASQPKS
jgi:hypothetical protein